ncbi:DnaJ homolog subfamily B member 9 [Seminavis robusta]|uniref:DnaJ homolog subfamily B member 9 n=1 Tax=Seminavis robusta TaxID=568900 RepID=A0A9N8H758_9STRA|nr:DnaJ homolog subfamily B member 9 [Seminavis robusta]|eukprot:Sro132_g062440.1 DnaJ homolog subfamily B member 9 (339) ;mRNA; r:17838-18854
MSSSNIDQVVESILNAKTLYDVLGVDAKNLDKAVLRKAYLKTSVAVHPDKCQHAQATQAFQRVAEAWGTLSDDGARAEYDAELRNSSYSSNNGYYNGNNHHGDKTHYANDFERTHMPSFQEALFMFATATSMFSGGGPTSRSGNAVNAASDFMETIFWAQRLAEGRNDNNNNDNNNPNNDSNNNGNYAQDRSGDFDNSNNNNNTKNSSTTGSMGMDAAAKDPLSSGMALGSGLRAIAGVQRAMGMRKSAAATEKAATGVQVAAMGAAVAQKANENPAVRRTLERGSNALKNNPQLAKGLRASLKMAGSVLQTMQQAQQEAQQQQSQQNGTSSSNSRRY